MARIGGDEFAVLITQCSRDVLVKYCQDIKKNIKDFNQQNQDLPPLSLSIGYAIRENRHKTMSQLFTEADNNMYREKLHRNLSSRSSIVSALMKALEARDFITEGHGERIEVLIKKVGKKMGLTPSNIYGLRLLHNFMI
ncbi:diguanylate cyclase domain-containing protein [Desulforamulus reducens]|uniref:diguanylate cyclase domain-containing protein n=1 Tax=Desulforamulus reducens TaxID=59610 RepID=UPI00006B4CAC|nr:diguanylate cyclase [Desulforamulus reducens]